MPTPHVHLIIIQTGWYVYYYAAVTTPAAIHVHIPLLLCILIIIMVLLKQVKITDECKQIHIQGEMQQAVHYIVGCIVIHNGIWRMDLPYVYE